MVAVTDDLTGELIPDGQDESVMFVWDGNEHEIDLSKENAAAMREMMKRYIDASRKIGKYTPTVKRPKAKTTGANSPGIPATPDAWFYSRPDNMGIKAWTEQRRIQSRMVRAWARDNGFPNQGDNGRLKTDVREAWNAAHPDQQVHEEDNI
jgi:hypothetical protein